MHNVQFHTITSYFQVKKHFFIQAVKNDKCLSCMIKLPILLCRQVKRVILSKLVKTYKTTHADNTANLTASVLWSSPSYCRLIHWVLQRICMTHQGQLQGLPCFSILCLQHIGHFNGLIRILRIWCGRKEILHHSLAAPCKESLKRAKGWFQLRLTPVAKTMGLALTLS